MVVSSQRGGFGCISMLFGAGGNERPARSDTVSEITLSFYFPAVSARAASSFILPHVLPQAFRASWWEQSRSDGGPSAYVYVNLAKVMRNACC